MSELNWSDGQWQKVKDSVTEAFAKASIANAFLPCYGPLSGSAETVRNEVIVQNPANPPRPNTISLDADYLDVNVKLVTVTVNVELSSEQVAEEALSNATLAFRRAANILAQEEDRVVFQGYGRGFPPDNSRFVKAATGPHQGLADLPARRRFRSLNPMVGGAGQAVVSAVVRAVSDLDDRFHPAPFACVMGNRLFGDANTPTQSLVLPADRIAPLLRGGPFLCSGTIDTNSGIIVSLAGNDVDIVVATPPTVQFLQRNEFAKFIFRVYERFVLRIRDTIYPPVAGFRIQPTPALTAAERQRLAVIAAQSTAARQAEDIEILWRP
jgi:uncharacterized linocin/CFP29 family protein